MHNKKTSIIIVFLSRPGRYPFTQSHNRSCFRKSTTESLKYVFYVCQLVGAINKSHAAHSCGRSFARHGARGDCNRIYPSDEPMILCTGFSLLCMHRRWHHKSMNGWARCGHVFLLLLLFVRSTLQNSLNSVHDMAVSSKAQTRD